MRHPEPEVLFLHDGGQPVDFVAERLLAFIAGAHRSLDVALYDAYFAAPPSGDGGDLTSRIVGAFNDAEERGVEVRAVFNDDDGPGPLPATVEPHVGPSFLHRLRKAIPAKGIDGRFDLMHHKYMIRDGDTVWTGSSNWTNDSWTRMENMILVVPNADLAAAYQEDFDDLWRRERVEGSGRFDDQPAALRWAGQPAAVRALFSPGRGRKMSQLIARRLGEARRRVRICSPVMTSTPILGTLAEVVSDGEVDTLVTWDATQMGQVLYQWERDGRSQWKAPLVAQLLRSGRVAGKQSTPYAPDSLHDFMHAKLVVCDDWVLTGSFNCSHSGERNAENLLEIHSPALADACAAFAEEVHARYIGASR